MKSFKYFIICAFVKLVLIDLVNYKNAKEAGLKVGAYWYAYATSKSEAIVGTATITPFDKKTAKNDVKNATNTTYHSISNFI